MDFLEICPREVPRVIRLSLGAAPLVKSDFPRDLPREKKFQATPAAFPLFVPDLYMKVQVGGSSENGTNLMCLLQRVPLKTGCKVIVILVILYAAHIQKEAPFSSG